MAGKSEEMIELMRKNIFSFYQLKNTFDVIGKIDDTKLVMPLISVLENTKSKIIFRRMYGNAKFKGTQAREIVDQIEFEVKSIKKELKKKIKGIVNSNEHFLESHHHLLCTECFLRSKKESAKVSAFKSYHYVICRGCGSSLRLIKDVKKITGLIGGGIDNYEVNDEKAFVSLWFEGEKKARNADIDILEIRE